MTFPDRVIWRTWPLQSGSAEGSGDALGWLYTHRSVEVYVCFGPKGLAEYPHWLLILQPPCATECTRIHSTGGLS